MKVHVPRPDLKVLDSDLGCVRRETLSLLWTLERIVETSEGSSIHNVKPQRVKSTL